MLTILLCAGISTTTAQANCSPFQDGLTSADTILANGGTIYDSITFGPAVNGNGAYFAGAGHVTYSGEVFASPRGTVTLWFRKASSDVAGGIVQIGQIGQHNSLGVFYNNQSHLYVEIRNDNSTYAAVSAPGALSQSEFTHIAATWDNREASFVIKLFINGRYIGSQSLPGLFVHDADTMDLGVVGVYGRAEGIIDELGVFDWPLQDSEIYAEYVYSSNRHRYRPTGKPTSTGNVKVVDKSLYVDGEPFTVKGVGYQPVPSGFAMSRETLDYIYTDPCIIARDIPLLRQMNVNTVRVWSELPDSDLLLDALYNDGVKPIYAIMGFWVSLTADYSDPVTIATLQSELQEYVSRFKNHPAVLAWAIGNENNLVYGGLISEWYALANTLAETAYIEEGAAYHPTMIINGGLRDFGDVEQGSDDIALSFVDMWGHNAYFGYDAHCYFDYYDRISAKPLIITEFGIDAFDQRIWEEYQDVQADLAVQQWRRIDSGCVGGTIMAYSDEWWKAGFPGRHDLGGYYTDWHPDGFSNEEWWGMVAVEDDGGPCDVMTPRLAYFALADEFTRELSVPTVSEWGLVAMAVLLLSAGVLVCEKDSRGDRRTLK